MSKSSKRWSDSEINFLINNFVIKGALWCAEELPNRTIEAIRIKAAKLNLKRDKELRYGHISTPDGYTYCPSCEQILPDSVFYRKESNNKYGCKPHQQCKSCHRERSRRAMRKNISSSKIHYNKHPEKKIFMNLKGRAKAKNIIFDLTLEDIVIPDVCPILKIPLIPFSASDNSPSVDRLIPELGYIKGNINIISNRANRIKSDASLNEIKAIYDWLKNIIIN
jgi:hypothetical protein